MKADLLSRCDGMITGENDNQDVTLLKAKWFRAITLRLEDDELVDRVKQSKGTIDDLVSQKIVTKDATVSQSDGCTFINGLLYIPQDLPIREEIIRLHHDDPSAGHPGVARTIELITRSYWWPGLTRYVKTYVKGCRICQETKIKRETHAPLHPNEIPSEL